MSQFTLSPNQENVVFNSTPFFQDWNFSPDEIILHYYQGTPIPDPVIVATQIKDVLGTTAVNNLSDIRYKTYIDGLPFFLENIQMSGDLYTGPDAYTAIETNGIAGDMTYTFQNLNILNPGTYQFAGYHKIFGTNTQGNTVLVSQASVNIIINVYDAVTPTIDTDEIEFVWQEGVTEEGLVESFTIDAPDWSIIIPPPLLPAGTGYTYQSLPEGGSLITGSGELEINLVLFPENYEAFDMPVNPYNFELTINGGLLTLPVQIINLEQSGMLIAQDELYFEAYKGISNAYPQFVYIHYQGQYEFICPPWLTILPHPGYYGNNYGFYVLGSDNLSAGIYEADVTIYDTSTQETLGTIHVTYNVIGNINLPYDSGYAFTLDNNAIELSSQLEDAYYEIQMIVKAYKYYSNSFIEHTHNFKIPLHNKKQNFNIGKIVDRLMARMDDINNYSLHPYKPAEVSLTLAEKSFSDTDYLQEYNVENILFIAGLQPSMYAGCGHLDLNHQPSRQTPSSYTYLNLILSNFPTMRVYKNGEEINYYGLTAGINSLMINFQNYSAAPGDVFKFQVETSQGNFSKIYKIFPPGKKRATIVWENEYKLQSVLECTGEYTLRTELENRTQFLMENINEVLKKLENRKSCRLTINTGYLLKSDITTVESLCRAKRAVILVPGSKINLIPIQKNITNVDSLQELIAFDIEFEIKRNYDEEVYTF